MWCCLSDGAQDVADGNDYFHAYATFAEAEAAAREIPGAGEPLALVLQREYIAEDKPGAYQHVRRERVTEWPVESRQSCPRRPVRPRDLVCHLFVQQSRMRHRTDSGAQEDGSALGPRLRSHR